MDGDERRIRIAFHEAGHAVLHFVLGRPIEYVVAEPACHETKPVDGTALEPHLESILWVCGLSAEQEWLRVVGRGDEAESWYPNSGALGDYSIVERLYSPEEIGEAEPEADGLVLRYWSAVAATAELLQATPRLEQDATASIAAQFGISFGEAAAEFGTIGFGQSR